MGNEKNHYTIYMGDDFLDDSQFLAHLTEDGKTETIQQHLLETAHLAAQFASDFDAYEQGYLAGLAHDIGKFSKAFQLRLAGSPHRVDHSTAGSVECTKIGQSYAAICIAGHHGGLPDGGSRTDNVDQPTMWGRLNRAYKGMLEPYDEWKEEIQLPKASSPEFLRSRTTSPCDAMFFTRMLYSCLVDADFLSTEVFMSGHKRSKTDYAMAELEQRLQKYVSGWYPPEGELNTLRCSILEHCRQDGYARKTGLFTLTVPTGGGKTVSSLAFALSHARANGLKRVIYVIPYTSIIEQNAKVFRKILGEDVVLEHHSGVLYDIDQEANPKSIRMAQATENWDMPVVVTTAVQFFDSLFSNRSSKCRKLHNLAKSVIIFDEAQMLPIPYLRPCIHAISQLVAHYHSSAVLCSATQPALKLLFQEFLPGVNAVELCPDEVFRSAVFQRVTFQKVGQLSWDQLADTLNTKQQVLCVVNSRKGAQEIFGRLTGDGCYHLSTLMYPAHRERVLKQIRERLNEHLPCRVVSTSLIEAGVDVDFPEVYREEAGLDSVLQAAGRCNREGKRNRADSIVSIFKATIKPPPIFSIPIGAGSLVMEQYDDISSQEAVSAYFKQLLEMKGDSAQDQQEILPLMKHELFPFRKIADRFHMIDSATRTIYIPLEAGAELVEQIRSGQCSITLFRKLGKYSVSVYENQFQSLEIAGALELLEDGSAILLDTTLYHPEQGLALKADSGDAFFV